MEGTMCLGGRFRFGTFEVDLRAGELRRKGWKVKLQEQPFQVLGMLLEHRGEVVAREELQKKLWPCDTFVDFEHGLNKAVNKIRRALGDSADSPRFVETVGRRGYRFMADVSVVDVAPPENPEPVAGRPPGLGDPARAEIGGRPAVPRTPPRPLAWTVPG